MPRRRAADSRESRPIRTRARSGCQRCRSSKVKCDEKQPTCSRCWRKGLLCRPPSIHLKWESDFVSHGLAFGRSGRWRKSSSGDAASRCPPEPRHGPSPSSSSSSSLSSKSLDDRLYSGMQIWCPIQTVRACHFVNSDMSTFGQPNIKWSKRESRPDAARTPSQDNSNNLTTNLIPSHQQGRDEICLAETTLLSSPLTRNLSYFPSDSFSKTAQGSLFFDYYLEQVCPRTTPSSRSPSPFASLVLPFCMAASPTVFKAIQALAACHWSRSDSRWATVGLRLRSEVLRELRARLARTSTASPAMAAPTACDSLKVNIDSEIFVIMMMLCLYELTDNCRDKQGWTVHLRGAKDIISHQIQQWSVASLKSPQNSNDTQINDIDRFARRFFAFQDVIGRTACGDVVLFGTDFWSSNEHTVDLWMGSSPELVSIIAAITELSRSRRAIFSDPLHDHATSTFSSQTAALENRLHQLVQVVEDDRDETLAISADLKRLAAILYLHCALYGASPSTPLVNRLVCQILQRISTLLQRGVVAGMTWPVFVAAVELGSDSLLNEDDDPTRADEKVKPLVYGRRLVLEALEMMAQSNLTNVALTRAVVVKVWHARDINSTLSGCGGKSSKSSNSGNSGSCPVDYSADLEAPQCNDWEWYVAPISAGVSLA